jgi:hypothetical protein
MAYKDLSRKEMCGIYKQMRQRCNNPNDSAYKNYGARGIKCLFNSVQELIDEIGPRPNKSYSVDRIDNNKHYEVGNIQWATRTQQTLNSRIRCDNKSGTPGIYYRKSRNTWCVSHCGKFIYEGPDYEKALAMKKAAINGEI